MEAASGRSIHLYFVVVLSTPMFRMRYLCVSSTMTSGGSRAMRLVAMMRLAQLPSLPPSLHASLHALKHSQAHRDGIGLVVGQIDERPVGVHPAEALEHEEPRDQQGLWAGSIIVATRVTNTPPRCRAHPTSPGRYRLDHGESPGQLRTTVTRRRHGRAARKEQRGAEQQCRSTLRKSNYANTPAPRAGAPGLRPKAVK